jgi:hypothetical protein
MPLNQKGQPEMFAGVDTRPRQQTKTSNSAGHHRSRSNSQPRSERRGSHGESGHRQSASARPPSRADMAVGLKADVPQTTIPRKSSNLKHQMSQSTLSDKENVDFPTQIQQEHFSSVRTCLTEPLQVLMFDSKKCQLMIAPK